MHQRDEDKLVQRFKLDKHNQWQRSIKTTRSQISPSIAILAAFSATNTAAPLLTHWTSSVDFLHHDMVDSPPGDDGIRATWRLRNDYGCHSVDRRNDPVVVLHHTTRLVNDLNDATKSQRNSEPVCRGCENFPSPTIWMKPALPRLEVVLLSDF